MRITRIAVHRFRWCTSNLGLDSGGFNPVYRPGGNLAQTSYVLSITTDEGLVGEYVGGSAASYAQVGMVADYLLGKDPLQRERIYADLKRALRKLDRMGIGPIDIALWDLAGKLYQAPIVELLGGFRDALPAYASTLHGDEQPDGLSSPEAFAEFALACRERGYPGFKIHGWHAAPVQREVQTVLATRRAVGDDMDLMLDPACEYASWADTLKVGRACDAARYLWLEDPYQDGGVSSFGHRKLRQLIRTPILIGEHLRGHELHVDAIVADGTDFVRADPDYDCGITGVMKIAHSAEGFGLDVEIHAPGPAQRHCMAAIRNTNYYELGLVHPRLARWTPPVYADGYSDELTAVDSAGCVRVPRRPGLGVTLDWDWIGAHQVDAVVYAE